MNPQEFRRIREHLGLTQPELAKILGLSGYIPVNHYESGFRTPSILIQSLMRIFDEWPEEKSQELRDDLQAHAEKLKKKKTRKS